MWIKLIKYNILKQDVLGINNSSKLKIKSSLKEVKNFKELQSIIKDYDDFEILEK